MCLPLVQLRHDQCRWPVNDAAPGEAHLFCGEPAVAERPYCAHHSERAVGRGTESERAAVRVLAREAVAP